MSKKKLVALGLTLVATLVTAAVQSGVLPNICPPPPVCASAARAAPSMSELHDAGAQ